MVSVLIVEDSATEASILVDCLQRSGFEVLNINTAEAAKAILAQRKFDVILVDVVLPGQSGFGLCRELKSQEATADIPIIICSNKSEKIDKNWGLKQGAVAYVTKPINTNEIVSVVKDVVKTI